MLTSGSRRQERLRPPAAGGRRAAPTRRRFDARQRDRVLAILVVSPSLLAVAVFVYLFVLWTGYASTIDWTTIFPDYTFVGLDNYRDVVADERFHTDLRNLVLFSLSFMAQCIVIGFVLAVLLNQRIKGEAVFRTIYILPFAVSLIVTGVAWHWLMQPTTGINLILQAVGLGAVQPSWYTSSDWGILAVSTANAWQMAGYIMAIYLAGLRGIPHELVEAARIDGCGTLALYRRVIIPLLTPVTFTAVLLTGMVSVKTFDILATMTGGGPGFATDMLGLFMYDLAFQSNLFARSASVAVIMMLIAGLLLIPYVLSNRRRERMGLG